MAEMNGLDPDQPEAGQDRPEMDAETRRQAIQRLGKLAAYTAPAMLGLLAAKPAAAQASPPP